MTKISLKAAKEAIAPAASETETLPKKVKKAKKDITDEKVTKSVVEKLKKEKDLMYLYPESDMSAHDKKKFRSTARRTLAARLKKVEQEPDAEKKAKLQRLTLKWAKTIYTTENLPTFE